MKITKEQFEDIITVGEAKAAAEGNDLKLHLVRETPNLNEEIENNKTFRYLGYIVLFTPETDYTIKEYFDTQIHGEKEWSDASSFEFGDTLNVFVNEVKKIDFLISYKGTRYASWEPFAKAFGITELVMFGTKVPKALAVRLTRLCEGQGETPSWRIRLLIQEYLEETIKNRARQVMFEG